MKRTQVESEELATRFKAHMAAAKDDPDQDNTPGEATIRSSPVTLDQTYQIRFDRQDIEDLEFALSAVYHKEIGYPEFVRILKSGSLKALNLFVWRGLRELTKEGKLIHVFDADFRGSEEAADLVWNFMQSDGNIDHLITQIGEGFVAAHIAYRVDPKKIAEAAAAKKGAEPPKNSQT